MKNHFVQCDRVLWDSLPWDDGEAARPWMSEYQQYQVCTVKIQDSSRGWAVLHGTDGP